MSLPEGEPWTDLARNVPGGGILHEAARRRQTEGAGSDRSWRVGADGEMRVAEVLGELTEVSRWDRLRRRGPRWRVLHSVPLTDRHGRVRGDVDHVLIGPPGVTTINTKHHRAGRLALDGEELVVNGWPTAYVAKARAEADRAAAALRPALTELGNPALAALLIVRPLIAVVGGRLLIERWAPGVTVVMTRQLVHTLVSMPAALDADQVLQVWEVARRSTTWITRGG